MESAEWCSHGGDCIYNSGFKCSLYSQNHNCCEIFSKFIMKYAKEIRENTKFCEHCGALIEKGDNDD